MIKGLDGGDERRISITMTQLSIVGFAVFALRIGVVELLMLKVI